MKAYVINQDQLKQYIFIAIAALVLSFVFGYIVGEGQNMASQEISKKTIDTAVTDTSSSLAMKKEPNILGAKTEKKDLKKSKLEKKKEEAKKPLQKNKTVTKKSTSNKQDSKAKLTEKKKKVVQKKTAEKEKKSASTNSKHKADAVNAVSAEKQSIKKSTSNMAESPDAVVQNMDQLDNKRSYSIQAGMFASKNNAENFIEKLAVEKFEAYVSDFVSTSGAVKYNVRVGRFEERNKAREKLKEYQKFFSTPAYVVISQ